MSERNNSSRLPSSLTVALLVSLCLFLFLARESFTTAITARQTEGTLAISIRSQLLSDFWQRDIKLRAEVVRPPSYLQTTTRSYPVIYHIPGLGGDHTEGRRAAHRLHSLMTNEPELEALHVFLDPSSPHGYTFFLDSVQNGPWQQALLTELIPSIDSSFRTIPHPTARFLTGHSSGGWSVLWLQLHHPHTFGGAWSTAPDPVDFRSFFGIDITPGSTDNFYRDSNGSARRVARGDPTSMQSYVARQRLKSGEDEFMGYEKAFATGVGSVALFDRVTGDLNPVGQRAFRAFDLNAIITERWSELREVVDSTFHIYCGERDTFFLDESVKLFCATLRAHGSYASCSLVPDRHHANLYKPSPLHPRGLDHTIYSEMAQQFRRSHH